MFIIWPMSALSLVPPDQPFLYCTSMTGARWVEVLPSVLVLSFSLPCFRLRLRGKSTRLASTNFQPLFGHLLGGRPHLIANRRALYKTNSCSSSVRLQRAWPDTSCRLSDTRAFSLPVSRILPMADRNSRSWCCRNPTTKVSENGDTNCLSGAHMRRRHCIHSFAARFIAALPLKIPNLSREMLSLLFPPNKLLHCMDMSSRSSLGWSLTSRTSLSSIRFNCFSWHAVIKLIRPFHPKDHAVPTLVSCT